MSKISLGLAIAVLLGSAANGTPAERYRLVEASDDAAFFVDDQTINTAGSRKTFWMMVVFIKDANPKQLATKQKVRITHDCGAHSARWEYVAVYQGDKVVDQKSFVTAFEPVVPGHVTETIGNYVCAGSLPANFRSFPPFSEEVAVGFRNAPMKAH